MPEQHGREKEPEADDPMELIGTPAPGDAEFMVRCLVEEFVRMGRGREELLALFRNPFYESAHALWNRFGEETVEEIVDAVLEDHAGYEVETQVTHQPPAGSEAEEGSGHGRRT